MSEIQPANRPASPIVGKENTYAQVYQRELDILQNCLQELEKNNTDKGGLAPEKVAIPFKILDQLMSLKSGLDSKLINKLELKKLSHAIDNLVFSSLSFFPSRRVKAFNESNEKLHFHNALRFGARVRA